MSTTASEIFSKVRVLLSEYSESGVVTSGDDINDLEVNTIKLIDMGQKELYKTGKLYKKFEYTNVPYKNNLGVSSNFDIVEYEGTTQYYPENGCIGKSYYFEVDGEATVKIQELQAGAWQDLITVSVPSTVTSMTAYKGIVTPTTAGNLVRLSFSGTYYYKHQNRALFNSPFSASRIPDYRPWIKLTMPSDFRAVDEVISEYPERQYSEDANYKWEGFKDLYVNYYYNGTIRVIYKPTPVTITALTDVLEIDDITAQALAYYAAAKLAPFNNKDLTSFYQQEFERLKLDSFVNMPQSESMIVNVYGGDF